MLQFSAALVSVELITAPVYFGHGTAVGMITFSVPARGPWLATHPEYATTGSISPYQTCYRYISKDRASLPCITANLT